MEKHSYASPAERNPMEKRQFRAYLAKTAGSGVLLDRANGAIEYAAKEWMYNFLEEHNRATRRDEIEPPLDAEHIKRTAEDFVERAIGIRPSNPIAWKHLDPEDYVTGTRKAYDGMIILTQKEYYPTGLLRNMETYSVAVHEKAHETSDGYRRGMSVLVPGENQGFVCSTIITSGMINVKPLQEGEHITFRERGLFFEEAFAEETATRWREEAIPGHEEYADVMWKTVYGVDMPRRYHNYADNTTEQFDTTSNAGVPAIAAYGMQLLTEQSGHDFYELMALSRHPDMEVEAKREFARRLNEIQPDLYERLAKVQYTQWGFIAGLSYVNSALHK